MTPEDWEGHYRRLVELICKLRKQNSENVASEPPSRSIPPELVNAFTLDGHAELLEMYFDSRNDSKLMSALVPYYERTVEVMKNEI